MTTTSGGLPLTSLLLQVPPLHIPDGKGGSYKSELVLERGPDATTKILWWHADDPRTEPHNHPWPFVSEILSGGYDDVRYVVAEDGSVTETVTTVRAGDFNTVPQDAFHTVRNVQPGTVTLMRCGALVTNDWGYLNVEDGTFTAWNQFPFTDPDFITNLRAINPHLRPKV